jgi:hypothetical protein
LRIWTFFFNVSFVLLHRLASAQSTSENEVAPLAPVLRGEGLGESDGVRLGQGLFQKIAIFCPIGIR